MEEAPTQATPKERKPQPEADPAGSQPALRRLRKREYPAIIFRGGKRGMQHNVTNLAAAVAYNLFLAIPSALLVVVGGFSLLAGPNAVHTIMRHLSTVMPPSAVQLLDSTLTRTTQANSGGLIMIVVGVLLALWSLSGAMQTIMWGTNIAYEIDDSRNFVKRRLIALVMIFAGTIAFALVFVLLVLGPQMSGWVGSWVGHTNVVNWVWWSAQWPILIVGLLFCFALVLYLAPNIDPPTWRFVSPGAMFAVVVWLAASALFAFYTSRFSSYNKAWGSLAAVIIMLTWLWLAALALLMGAEINAEAERRREAPGRATSHE
ncbi:MAG: YihY/virulence factor BrkB family protein [Gaiellales bacterium]